MISITAAAAHNKASARRLQALCKAGRIPGAELLGRMWFLPSGWKITPGKRGPKLRMSEKPA